MGNNIERSYREIALAQKVAWAQKNSLHPRAVKYAGTYLNLDHQMLQLISAYETAADHADNPVSKRELAMRVAWDNVIKYVRLLARKEELAA